jgi:hypothetical protein
MGIVLTLALALTIENQTLTLDAATGRAVIDVRGESQVRIRNVVIEGARDQFERRLPIAENGAPFIDYYPRNGISIDRSTDVVIEDVILRNIPNLAIVVARSSNVRILRVTVEDSGSRDARGRNNTTGGILIEEGTSDFEIRDCRLTRIRGNAIWTHSYSESPRVRDGLIVNNEIDTAGRDGIQVGHATRIRVEDNVIRNIGYPTEIVDVENHGYPAAIDTAGVVDKSSYNRNRIFEVNGKCFDLDGFQDSEMLCNLCINTKPPEAYPNANLAIVFNDSHPDSASRNIRIEQNIFDGMIYGGAFVYGSGHRITRNRFLNLNRMGYDGGPDYLRSGIFVAGGVLRPNPPSDVVIRDNTFQGHKMKQRCVLFAPDAPRSGVRFESNECAN